MSSTTAGVREGLRWARPLDHPEDYHLDFVIDGVPTRVYVPKEQEANLAWREELLKAGERDLDKRAAIMRLVADPSAAGLLFWLNAFGWTYRQNKVDDAGRHTAITTGDTDYPFITWPIQDEILTTLVGSVENGRKTACDKSRDMGMTWQILACFTHMACFRRGVNFLVMSVNEEMVDNPDDPDCLFWKIDYLVESMPWWMRPAVVRRRLRWVNTELNSTIIGKSTTARQGRGGRKTAAMLDEAATMDNLKSIWVSMSYTTQCIIANSTPFGPGFFSQLVRSPEVTQIKAPWWDHPMYGRDRYETVKPDGTIEIRSPWYDIKVDESQDPLEIAQELNMDHQGSGMVVFPSVILRRQEARWAPLEGPLYAGDLVFDEAEDRDLNLRKLARKDENALANWWFTDEDVETPWSLWCDLEEDHLGRFRPPQNRTYAIGIDVSWGQGRSNSVMVVKDCESGEQVATYANARVGPEEFARLAAAAGYWFGGPRGCAFLCWEANGGGDTFGLGVRKLRYPWVYFDTPLTTKSMKKSERYGWFSNVRSKTLLLGQLRGAMARDELKVQDRKILAEAEEYIFFDSAAPGPGSLKDESPVALATHGDRVIGAALAEHGSRWCERCRPPERESPFGSVAWRADRGGRGEDVPTRKRKKRRKMNA